MKRLLTALVLAALVVAPSHAKHFKPVDEATKDPSFVHFRDDLKVVIARKDLATLIKVLARDVLVDFVDGAQHVPAFHRRWNPSAANTEVWATLSLIVNGGGKFSNPNEFTAPYTANAPEEVDIHTSVVVTNPNAVLRRGPNAAAPVIRKLDHDVLDVLTASGKLQHQAGPNDWERVKDGNGQVGYVATADVRSPADYHVVFQKRGARWIIREFWRGE